MQNPHRPHQAYYLVTLQVVLRENGRLPCVCVYLSCYELIFA